jgi:hypothetical protein
LSTISKFKLFRPVIQRPGTYSSNIYLRKGGRFVTNSRFMYFFRSLELERIV